VLFFFWQIIKALNLYRKKTGSNKFFWVRQYNIIFNNTCKKKTYYVSLLFLYGKIHLDKQVPTGAGLGGGSSNAATALWAANQLNGGLVSEKELQDWSSEIGSDIPFFFSHGAAYCTGRGEVCLCCSPFCGIILVFIMLSYFIFAEL